MKKTIPYGTADFEKIVTQGYYYIDKTMYIEKLEKAQFPVFLRPRRFGKSLFTEMLRCYYDIKLKDRFEEIFGNLYIGKKPTKKHNSFFFMSFTFSGMDIYAEMSERELKSKFDISLLKAVKRFMYHYHDTLNLNQSDVKEIIEEYKNNGVGAVQQMITLAKSFGHKTYITIDEYDSLTNALAIRYRHSDASDNMYLRILGKGGFFRNFFEMLKTESQNAIEQIYITGILPITIADMTSGYNIASWIHYEDNFVNMLGITQTEFEEFIDLIYNDYEITIDKQLVKDTVKKYYNGYRFLRHAEDVYNPMMTMYFLNSVINYNKFPTHLADRNLRMNYDQIAFIFGQNSEGAKEVITDISEHKQIITTSDLQISFDMKDFKYGKYIVEGLFYIGILTYSEEFFKLKIPNAVTYTFALDYFNELQNFEYSNKVVSKWISQYFLTGDANVLIEGFFRDVIQKFPGAFFANANESFYHGMLFSVLENNTQKDIYQVLPEYNLPQGCADLMLKTYPHSISPRPMTDLFELKQVPKSATDEALQKKFEEAKTQLQKYKTGRYKNWRGIAVCFRGNKDFLMEIL